MVIVSEYHQREDIAKQYSCEKKTKKLKGVMGIREIISQNLSNVFQGLSSEVIADMIVGELASKGVSCKKAILSK